MRHVITILMLLLCASAFAAGSLLRGKIGPYPVVMYLKLDRDDITGNYFYEKSLSDIELVGHVSKGKSILYHLADFGGDTLERFTLTKTSNTIWSGQWVGTKGRPLKVSLTVQPLTGVSAEDAYGDIRAGFFKITEGARKPYGSYTLVDCYVTPGDIEFERIGGGLDSVIAARVNKILDNDAIGSAISACNCSFYSFSITSRYLTPNIISFGTVTNWDCGGAHPNVTYSGITIDARTGNQLALDDVLYLTDTPRIEHPEYGIPGQMPWTVSDHYLSQLEALLEKLFPIQMSPEYAENPENEYQCNYLSGWSEAAWFLTPDGLRLIPSFAHVIAVCSDENWSVIPYAELKKHRNPHKKISLP